MKNLYIILVVLPIFTFAQCYEQIGLGGIHVSALKPDGIWGWGDSQSGQLGNTYPQNANPIQISTNTDWDKLFVSYANRTFAIKNNGTLWGIGSNYYGALGTNATTSSYTTFQQISTATNWLTVDSDQATLAVKTDGTLWGWGQTDSYELGQGLCCGAQLAPIQLGTATDWVDAQTGSSTSMALKSNGTIWGWGSNVSNLLGQFDNYKTSMIQLNTATDWASFNLGFSHVLALKTDGTLWGWGGNETDQLTPNATPTTYNFTWVPYQIGTDTWKEAKAFGRSSFGIKTDGTLWGWGLNDEGQIGLGYTSATVPQPTQITTDNDWVAVYGGGCVSNCAFFYAVKTDGSIWAWGSNDWCQYGDGTGNIFWGGPTANTYTVPTQLTMHCMTPTLSTPSYSMDTVTLYPNPATNNVTISYANVPANSTLYLYDQAGRLISHTALDQAQGSTTLNTAHLAAGLYIAVVKNNDTFLAQYKLVKQ